MPSEKFTQKSIADALEKEIVENEMVLGVKLPSASQLAHKYGVSVKTADRALNLLEKKNLVSREHGRGNFVKANRRLGERLQVAFVCNVVHDTIADLTYPATGIFYEMICRKFEEQGIKYNLFLENLCAGSLADKISVSKYDVLILPAGVLNFSR